MKIKVECTNTLCKNYNSNTKSCIKDNITISCNGCESFVKGMQYYINLVWKAIENTNMIFKMELDDELKLGLFLVMKIWNLSFKDTNYGFIFLVKGEDGKALKHEDIVNDCDILFNYEEYLKYKEMDLEGKLLDIIPNKNKDIEEEKEEKDPEYGWLSPKGTFYTGEFGEHESIAHNIIKKYYKEEYWKEEKLCTAGDFLVKKKNFVLIDRPSGILGPIQVTRNYERNLTKKQKEFLYDYFVNIGDKERANNYLGDN